MTKTQEEHWNYSIYEWQNEDYFKTVVSILNKSEIKNIIDIGANVGGVTQVLLDNIQTIENCYLFEPQKDNFNFLFNKFKHNEKVNCLNFGIFYGKKYSNMFKFSEHSHVGAYTVSEEARISKQFNEDEEVFHLFELEFFNFKNIDFVKIDIEGSEYNVIENSEYLQSIKFIEIELHKKFEIDYFIKYFPNHKIAWMGSYCDKNGNYNTNHLFFEKIR